MAILLASPKEGLRLRLVAAQFAGSNTLKRVQPEHAGSGKQLSLAIKSTYCILYCSQKAGYFAPPRSQQPFGACLGAVPFGEGKRTARNLSAVYCAIGDTAQLVMFHLVM
jgi:hypothetical protein